MSHVDPRMSWGDLVARLVRDAVARHDPRGGGRGQRRKGADSAGASPRRAPKETRAAGAAGGPAQRVGEASGRAPNRTGAAGAAAGPAQRADESSGRAPNRTRAAVAPVAPALRTGGAAPAPLGAVRAPRHGWDGARAGGALSGRAATSAPAVGARGTVGWRPCRRRSIGRVRRYFGAAVRARGTVGWRSVQVALHRARPPLLRRRSPRPRHGWMAPVQAALHRARPLLLRRRSRRTRHGWMAPVQAALHRALPPLLRRRSRRTRHGWMARVQVALDRALPPLLRHRSRRRGTVGWRPCRRRSIGRFRRYFGTEIRVRRLGAPMPAPRCRARRSLLRRRSRHSAGPLTADQAARQPERRPPPRRLASLRGQANRARRSPLRRRSPPSARSPAVDRPTHQPGQRHTRPAILPPAATNLRLGATFPRRSGATSGYATVVAAVIAIRSPAGAAPLPICCRSTTCCPSPRAVARSRPTWFYSALLITECATATARRCRRNPRCSASSARLARRSAAPADSLPVARRGYPSQRREPSVHLRYRLFRPGPIAVDALTRAVVAVSRQRFPAASGVRTSSNARLIEPAGPAW